jgi:large subunit ribosomal protein L17
MRHQSGKVKLNVKESHKRSLMRNQVIHLIMYGHLTTTRAQAKEVKRLAEKVITLARKGPDFNTKRRVRALLPYKLDALKILFTDIAPRYVERPGGYTRLIPMGRRPSDTATIARLEWV